MQVNFTKLIIDKLQLDPNLVVKKKIRGFPGFTLSQLISALLGTDTLEQAAEKLNYTLSPIKTAVSTILRPAIGLPKAAFGTGGTTGKWKTRLLLYIDYKHCYNCSQILSISAFCKDDTRFDKLNAKCRACDKIDKGNKTEHILIRTPEWADKSKIYNIYKNCPSGYEVDHVIPLRGKLVSGLHVETNLQYLSSSENKQKSNIYIPH